MKPIFSICRTLQPLVALLLAQAAYAQLSPSAYRVLGQPDLRQRGLNMLGATGVNTPLGIAVDLRGGAARLYISDTGNSRVLAWADVRSYQMGDPPALILGQPGPEYSNPLGIGVKGLDDPLGLAVSPLTGDLYVADYSDNRVVRFPSPFANPTRIEPDAVYGQPNFTTRTAAAASATSLRTPRSLAFDSQGNLWIADSGNHRILRFPASSLDSGPSPAADAVIGQKDFLSSSVNGGGTVSASGLNIPAGLAFDAQDNLFVSDYANARVLKFAAPLPAGNAYPAAAGVLGQANFTARVIAAKTSASSIVGPQGLAVDNSGNVYVSVPGENRVLVFPPAAATGSPASGVFGQPDLITATPNTGAAPTPSSSSLSGPADVKVDNAGNLFIADSSNNRALQMPVSSKSASKVWGQPGFTLNGFNQVKPGSLYAPYRMAIDYSAAPFPLYVADANNHRVLIWKDAARFHSGDPADLVIGQPDLFTGSPNSSSPTPDKPSAVSLSTPTGVAVDPADGTLYIADAGNNRVLRYPRPVNQSGRITPNAVFGQPDFVTATGSVASATTLNHPFAVAIAPNRAIFICDTGNSRVLEFAAGAGSGAAALRVFGQPNFSSAQKPSQPSAQTLNAPQGIALDQASNLYVADTAANRVVVFPNTEAAPNAGAVASFVIGQTAFNTAAATRLRSPADVGLDGSGSIYVADSSNNRVLQFPSLVLLAASGAPAAGVVGQADVNGVVANWTSNDGLATPQGLFGPVGLYFDRQDTLYVADAGNNRIVHFLKRATVVNGATLQGGGAVAPGSLATVFTAGVLNDASSMVSSDWPTSLLNRELIVNSGPAAPLYYLDAHQANFQVPSNTAVGAQQVAVRIADTGELIAGGTFQVAAATPGLFTMTQNGSGQAAALNQDYSLNSPSKPAAAGSTIILYGTGQGPVSPAVPDGAPASGLSNTLASPTSDGKTCLTSQSSMCVAIGAAFGTVTYSGLAPGFVGLWQINVVVPPGLPAGQTNVRVVVNGVPSNIATVSLR